jgi:hypothetical protein
MVYPSLLKYDWFDRRLEVVAEVDGVFHLFEDDLFFVEVTIILH